MSAFKISVSRDRPKGGYIYRKPNCQKDMQKTKICVSDWYTLLVGNTKYWKGLKNTLLMLSFSPNTNLE